MNIRLGEVAASALLAALAGAACLGAWRLGLGDVHTPGPGFMPFAAAALLGAMATIQLVRSLVTAAGDPASPPTRSAWPTVTLVLATLVAFGAVIDRLGFALTTFLMQLVLFGVVARKRWWIALVAALAIAVAASLAFRALGLQLPGGPLGL